LAAYERERRCCRLVADQYSAEGVDSIPPQ
jgi:hypothetical protein